MRAALATALVLAGVGATQAATLTVTDTGTLGTGFEVPLSVAAFEPSLGTLTAVAWSLVIDWSAEVTFRNPNSVPVLMTVNGLSGIGFDIVGASLSPGLTGLEGYVPLTPFEFLFRDGLTFLPSLAPGEAQSTTAPPRTYALSGGTDDPVGLGAGVLSDWTGPGDVGGTILPLTIVYATALGPNASGQLVNLPVETPFTQDLTATLSVTYTYDPVTGGGGGPDDPVDPVPVVPLPAGLPLLLGGLAALAVVRRRRGA
jgi:hypothetical protein